MWLTDQQNWHHLEFVRQAEGQAHPDLKNQILHINKIPGQCMCGRVLVKTNAWALTMQVLLCVSKINLSTCTLNPILFPFLKSYKL